MEDGEGRVGRCYRLSVGAAAAVVMVVVVLGVVMVVGGRHGGGDGVVVLVVEVAPTSTCSHVYVYFHLLSFQY